MRLIHQLSPKVHRHFYDDDDHGPTKINRKILRFHDPYDYGCYGHPVPYAYLQNALENWVGKPWAELHSKWSAKFPRKGDIGPTIWLAIEPMVDDSAFVEGGFVWVNRYWWNYFVHPLTGTLEKVPPREIIPYPVKPIESIRLDGMHNLERVEGIWYLDTFHMVDHSYWSIAYKHVFNTLTGRFDSILDGRVWIVRTPSKELKVRRQLSRKQLKARGLVNTPSLIASTRSHRERYASLP